MPSFSFSPIADPTPTTQVDLASIDQNVNKTQLGRLAVQTGQQDLSDRDQVRNLLSGFGGSGSTLPNALLPYAMGGAVQGQGAAANDPGTNQLSGAALSRQLAGLGKVGQDAAATIQSGDDADFKRASARQTIYDGLAAGIVAHPEGEREALWHQGTDFLVNAGLMPADAPLRRYPGHAAASVIANLNLTPAERIQLLQNTYTPDGVQPGATPGGSGAQAGATTGATVGNLSDTVLQNESGGSMRPGQYGDGSLAAGPMQVHPAALADVNAKLGTNYTHAQLASNPAIGKLVGDTYLGMMREQFGRDDYALGAYNAGPGAMQAAIVSGRGVAGLPSSTQQYVASGMARLRPPQGGGAPQGPVQVASASPANGAPPVATDVSGADPTQNPADAVMARLRAQAGQGGAPTQAAPSGSFADTLGQWRTQGLAAPAPAIPDANPLLAAAMPPAPVTPSAVPQQAPPGQPAPSAGPSPRSQAAIAQARQELGASATDDAVVARAQQIVNGPSPGQAAPSAAPTIPGQNPLLPAAMPPAGARTVPNPPGPGQAPAQAATQPMPQQAAPAAQQAAAPASTQPGMPPSTPLPQGAVWMRNGFKQIDTRDVPKGYGVIQQANGQRVPWPLPNVAPEGRNTTMGNVETGQTVVNSRGQTLYSTPPNTLAVQDQLAKEDRGTQQQQTDVALASQQQQSRLLEARQVMQGLPTGANGESRAAWANWAETYMSPAFAAAFKAKLNLPDAAPAMVFAKLMTQNAGNQERAVAGSRGGIQMMQLFKSANPGLEMRPEANRDILNAQLVATQADQDYARGYVGWVNEHGSRLLNREQGYTYQPASRFDQAWIEQRNPQVYVAAANAMNGKPFADWSRGLNPQDASRAMGIIARIDPTATVTGSNGHPLAVRGFLSQQQGQAGAR